MYAFRTIPKTGRRRHIPADKTDTFLRDNGGKVLNLRRNRVIVDKKLQPCRAEKPLDADNGCLPENAAFPVKEPETADEMRQTGTEQNRSLCKSVASE